MTTHRVQQHFRQVDNAKARKLMKRNARRIRFERNRLEWQQKVDYYVMAKLTFCLSWFLAAVSLATNALRLWR